MDADLLRDWLDGRLAAHEFSGAVLVWRDGKSLFSYAGGIAHRGHGVPVTGSTRFTVASVTKMVTATTALRLVERVTSWSCSGTTGSTPVSPPS